MKDARPEVVLRGDALAGELNDIINPFFLRREKKDVFSKQNRELYPETPNEKKEERQEGAKKDDKCRRSDLPREYLTPDNILRKQCVESPIVRRYASANRSGMTLKCVNVLWMCVWVYCCTHFSAIG